MKQKCVFIPLALVLLLDRLTKLTWAESEFVILPHILGVHGTRNTGMAFGLLSGKPLLLAVISAIVLIALFMYLKKLPVTRWEGIGLGLLIGGAIGNLIDRLAYGYVIDMMEPLFMRLFIFNVADAGITIGAAILMICLLFGKEKAKDGTA